MNSVRSLVAINFDFSNSFGRCRQETQANEHERKRIFILSRAWDIFVSFLSIRRNATAINMSPKIEIQINKRMKNEPAMREWFQHFIFYERSSREKIYFFPCRHLRGRNKSLLMDTETAKRIFGIIFHNFSSFGFSVSAAAPEFLYA